MDKLLRKKSNIVLFLAPAFILFTAVLFSWPSKLGNSQSPAKSPAAGRLCKATVFPCIRSRTVRFSWRRFRGELLWGSSSSNPSACARQIFSRGHWGQ